MVMRRRFPVNSMALQITTPYLEMPSGISHWTSRRRQAKLTEELM